jgi:hypothetical protein
LNEGDFAPSWEIAAFFGDDAQVLHKASPALATTKTKPGSAPRYSSVCGFGDSEMPAADSTSR